MIYRSCTLNDLDGIYMVNKEIYGDDCYPKVVLRQFYDCFNKHIKIAIENDTIVGFSINGISSDSDEAWILSLGVSKAFRHSGVGTKLLSESIEELKKTTVKVIKLTVHPSNKAILMYKKMGFKESDLEENYYGDNKERLIMNYSINQ